MPRRRLKGKVVSDKMEKTVVVAVVRVFAHPVYKKRVKLTKRFQADDRFGKAVVGNKVVIEETRPLSKSKRWKVVEVEGKKVEEKKKGKQEKKEKKGKRAKKSSGKRRKQG
jgi:small subunit ribosomal protein S17